MVSAPEMASPCRSLMSPLMAVRYPTVRTVLSFLRDASVGGASDGGAAARDASSASSTSAPGTSAPTLMAHTPLTTPANSMAITVVVVVVSIGGRHRFVEDPRERGKEPGGVRFWDSGKLFGWVFFRFGGCWIVFWMSLYEKIKTLEKLYVGLYSSGCLIFGISFSAWCFRKGNNIEKYEIIF